MQIDRDVFASGQILSKLWLAETLEAVIAHQEIADPLKILILGGWYGQLHLIFRIRKKLKIDHTTSIDIDPEVKAVADAINETWVWQSGKFSAITGDANNFSYSNNDFNLVINTSVEHIESNDWFENIPSGTLVVLQSNNMRHDDHHNNHQSLQEFLEEYKMSEYYYDGVKAFSYPDQMFKRYMIIGRK
jgi:hypothetical protein